MHLSPDHERATLSGDEVSGFVSERKGRDKTWPPQYSPLTALLALRRAVDRDTTAPRGSVRESQDLVDGQHLVSINFEATPAVEYIFRITFHRDVVLACLRVQVDEVLE